MTLLYLRTKTPAPVTYRPLKNIPQIFHKLC
uniref:Uncharacterized protein n=1 Tax=Anguilla anguilla TaxID=7936 RepID=A0A0E9XWJ2_ANGAN